MLSSSRRPLEIQTSYRRSWAGWKAIYKTSLEENKLWKLKWLSILKGIMLGDCVGTPLTPL